MGGTVLIHQGPENQLDSLCHGQHFVISTDGQNFKDTVYFNIDIQAQQNCVGFAVHINKLTENSVGLCVGKAGTIIDNGVAPFQIAWKRNSDGMILSTDTIIDNACGGFYNVQVRDANNCIANKTFEFFGADTTVNNCSGFQGFTSVIQQPTSATNCDGSASIEFTGGTAPFTIAWSDSITTSNVLNNACIGNYSVEVTDANNCKIFRTINLNLDTNQVVNCNNFYISFNKTQEVITGQCNGEAMIQMHNGTAPFQINWRDSIGNGDMISGACAREYNVYVYDANNCFASSVIKFGGDKNCDTLNAQTIVMNESVNGLCNGSVQVYPIGGLSPFVYNWENQRNTTGTISGLCSGEINVLITDANGCTGNVLVGIGADSVLVECTNVNFNIDFQTTPAGVGRCNGEILSYVSGGTEPYNYNWNNGYLTRNIKNVCRGVYQLTVTDANNCSHTQNIFVEGDTTQITPLEVSFRVFNETALGACDGRLNVSVSGGTAPYTIDHENQTGANIAGLCAGKHTFVVSDANGQSFNGGYLISSPQNTIINTTNELKDSVAVAIVESPVISNCIIDFNNIDSIVAYENYVNIDGYAVVTWRIYNNSNYIEVIENYSVNQLGIYTVILNLYCSQASGNTESLEFVKGIDKIIVDQVLSTQKITQKTVKFYPNPTVNQLFIETDFATQAQLLDITGRLLQTLVLNNGVNTIDLSTYPAGIYFVQSPDFKTLKVVKK